MLTFRKHKDNITIAQIKDGKDKKDIYIKRTYDNKAKPEIDTTDEEKEEIETFIEENDFYELEGEGWMHSDTYMYIWGPIEITDSNGEVVKVVNE